MVGPVAMDTCRSSGGTRCSVRSRLDSWHSHAPQTSYTYKLACCSRTTSHRPRRMVAVAAPERVVAVAADRAGATAEAVHLVGLVEARVVASG